MRGDERAVAFERPRAAAGRDDARGALFEHRRRARVSASRKYSSPSSSISSRGPRPSSSLTTSSRSTNVSPSSFARARPTVVLPAPMKPVMTTRRRLISPSPIRAAGRTRGRRRRRTPRAPSISVSPSAASAATAKAIAMRWSPYDSKRAPRSRDGAFDAQAVLVLLDLRAHRAEILDRRRDAVGLLHAQLARVANLKAARDLRADDGEHRQLVYEMRDRGRRGGRSRRRYRREPAGAAHADVSASARSTLARVLDRDARRDARSVSSTPARVGFRPTPSTSSSEPAAARPRRGGTPPKRCRPARRRRAPSDARGLRRRR